MIAEEVEVVLWVYWEVPAEAVAMLVWYVLKDVDGTEYVGWEELTPDEVEVVPDETEPWVVAARDVVSLDIIVKADEVKNTVEAQLVKIE